ncbi:MAG: AAA family ATPase [Magnetococcales bacterium]|nr:AAA family ATPase [Magnetococcales bacterium]
MQTYAITLEPAVDGGFVFVRETVVRGQECVSLLVSYREADGNRSLPSWKVFHFHDTSETAGIRRAGALHDQEYLRPDGANQAAFLFWLHTHHPDIYAMIRKTVALAMPFFDDFVLRPRSLALGEEQIQLLWRQKGSDYPLWPSQLSDGSLRFIALTTALLQPAPPATILIDEPELGLHPYAITLLGSLLRGASERMQVIVSTQSLPLINEFAIEDLLIVEREEGNTVFRRHTEERVASWLEEYSVGDLWMKNLLGGRPQS